MLKNKIALVTGASRGLGQEFVRTLERLGATVAAHHHSTQPFKADLRDRAARVKLVHDVVKRFGRIDILVNNVGSFAVKPIDKTSIEEFDDIIETNLTAAFHLSTLVLPAMRRRKWGHIINIGCAGADRMTIRPLTTPYYLAKTGVIMMTKALAEVAIKDGVRVNSISPGVLETSIRRPPQPSGRIGKLTDITRALEFILDEKNSFVCGSNIEVAGGWLP